ncbi:hypothetical protein GQ457_07G021300 [Hibiscus cannabinus]
MIQSLPQLNSIGVPGVEEPIRSAKREFVNDLFNVYMNLENLGTLNSSGTEEKYLDSRVSGSKKYGGETPSSDNEVEKGKGQEEYHLRYCSDCSTYSKCFDGILQIDHESTKRNQGVHQSTGSCEFNEAELK